MDERVGRKKGTTERTEGEKKKIQSLYVALFLAYVINDQIFVLINILKLFVMYLRHYIYLFIYLRPPRIKIEFRTLAVKVMDAARVRAPTRRAALSYDVAPVERVTGNDRSLRS